MVTKESTNAYGTFADGELDASSRPVCQTEEQSLLLSKESKRSVVARQMEFGDNMLVNQTYGRIIILLVGLASCAMFAGQFVQTTTGHSSHTQPSFLSVVHHETKELLSPVNNPLYESLKHATFHTTTSPPKSRKLRKEEMSGGTHSLDFKVDKTKISFLDSLNLSWRKDQANDEDVIAIYCPADAATYGPTQFMDAATIAQARASSEDDPSHSIDYDKKREEWNMKKFPIVRQSTCAFYFWKKIGVPGSSQDAYEIGGSTDPIELLNANNIPTALHLSFTNDPTEMVVSFTTGDEATPIVEHYEKEKDGKTNGDASLTSGVSTTYLNDDMCQEPATSIDPGKFIFPGYLHKVTLQHLKPDTEYTYRVGTRWMPQEILGVHGPDVTDLDDEEYDNIVWSDPQTFRTSPLVGSSEPFRYIVYGDQGIPEDGWSLGAKVTANMVERELNDENVALPIRSVHHIGDLSYARGAAHVWDSWFAMIESITSRVPLMIAVGNHEYDHTEGGQDGKDPSGVNTSHGYQPWFTFLRKFRNDSGGECGVPVAKRFTMPDNGNGVFWYSHDYANVHTVVVSSEHSLRPGSVQYKWLERDLASVDRTKTPWVVLESHRPMYDTEWGHPWGGETSEKLVGRMMRREFEDLLKKFKVDMFLAGHYHSYSRMCDGLFKGECNKGGPQHITIGTAGASLSETRILGRHDWIESFKREWGYGRMTVANATALHWEFVGYDENGNGVVKDDYWVKRDRSD